MTGKPPRPQPVRVLMARMKRKGVVITLVDGRVQVDGWKQLPPEEKEELRADRERIVAWLMARELKRQRRAKRKQEQQQAVAMPHEQRKRKVVGQVVMPGRPLRLLYDDEVSEIPRHARIVGTVSNRWRQ